MITAFEARPPLASFTRDTAITKVRLAKDAWNSRDPARVAPACSVDSRWRNRSEFVSGREAIIQFLTRKWQRERDYRLIKDLWTFGDDRIAVRFAYEWQVAGGEWFRACGNENWQFDEHGRMTVRHASINDVPIRADERKFLWPQGAAPTIIPASANGGCRSLAELRWPLL